MANNVINNDYLDGLYDLDVNRMTDKQLCTVVKAKYVEMDMEIMKE
jgi:hypothetical protein